MEEKMPDSGRKKRLIILRNRVMQVGEGTERIEDASDVEKAYVAGIIDGEGGIILGGERRQPRISVAMKSILPYKLWERYGGRIYNRYAEYVNEDGSRSLIYTWNIGSAERIRNFITAIMPFSKIKHRQLGLLSEALDLKAKYRQGRIRSGDRTIEEIARLISELNTANPVYIEIESYKPVKSPGMLEVFREWQRKTKAAEKNSEGD